MPVDGEIDKITLFDDLREKKSHLGRLRVGKSSHRTITLSTPFSFSNTFFFEKLTFTPFILRAGSKKRREMVRH